jgi:ATP-binding protein involved in chromosome partitioning
VDVLDALRSVREPELRRGLLDLDLVRGTRVRRGTAHVTVAVPQDNYPAADELRRRVEASVGALDGVDRVEVELTVLDENEVVALRERLEGDVAAPAQGQPSISFAAPGSHTRVLGISSGKGGVGKSSVTVNLAIALAQRGLEVAVVDADRPPVVVDRLIIPPVAYDVACISMGFFAADDQPVIWRGPMLHKALEQFLTDVHWGEPDFVLVDMPPGTGDVALSMAQYLPRSEVFVVTTPQPAAQRVAQRSALMAAKVNLSVAGVIENMSWFTGDDGQRYEIFGAGGGHQLAEHLEVPLVGQIPLVTALREGGDEGRPITVAEPESEAARAFAAIAETIVVDLAPKRIYKRELTIR